MIESFKFSNGARHGEIRVTKADDGQFYLTIGFGGMEASMVTNQARLKDIASWASKAALALTPPKAVKKEAEL